MQSHRKSDVARFLAEYELEYAAAQRAMNGVAQGVAQHAFITAKMERMCNIHVSLAGLVGEGSAVRLVSEAVKRLP